MANLTDIASFSDVYQLEIPDPVQGGSGGVSNIQAQALANRTKYLKDKGDAAGTLGDGVIYTGNLDSLKTAGKFVTTTAATNGPVGSQVATVEVIHNVANNHTSQVYVTLLSPSVYVRSFITGAWTSWTALATATALNNLQSAMVGAVAHFAQATPPAGWVKANGQALSRADYSVLFAAIGTSYGVGDGSTTFNVPDLRGEFIRGVDDGRGVDASRVLGSAQGGQVEEHVHGLGYGIAAFTHDSGTLAGYKLLGSGESTQDFGGNETRPRNVALTAAIFTAKY